jgi:putative adhesin
MRAFVTAVVLVSGASLAFAQNDFNWRGQIASGQTLEVRGVNGEVNASVSGSGDAEVHATKSANRSDPASVRIVVVPHSGGVLVCAVYPSSADRETNTCDPGPNNRSNTNNNDTQVRFDVKVPAGVKFIGKTVNGDVTAESLNGDAEGHTVNGSVKLSTTGNARANTVNGSLDVTMGRAEFPEGAKFSTVNGGITLRVPSYMNAHLKASAMNGSIESDLPITATGAIRRGRVDGTIGSGGQELQVSTVNGSIRLRAQ